MKKFVYFIIGLILLFPKYTCSVFGLDITDFTEGGSKATLYKPENLPGTETLDVTAEQKIVTIFSYVTDLILYASGSVAVFFIVYGGIRYVTSLGDQERMDGAKKSIKYAVIGLFAVIFAYAIVTNVIDLLYRSAT